MSETVQRIAMLSAVVTGFVLFTFSESNESITSTEKAEPTRATEAPQAAKKRPRRGPRKPPPAAMAIQPDEEDDQDDGLTDQERKLEEYLEHVEALDNPNIDEMTMLGEMAFEAQENQAAYDHYLEVIDNHSDDPKSAFALYKLAWTEYNLGDVEAAIDDMELMLEWVADGDSALEEMLRTAGPTDLEMFQKKGAH